MVAGHDNASIRRQSSKRHQSLANHHLRRFVNANQVEHGTRGAAGRFGAEGLN
jgi:hypothetical protein